MADPVVLNADSCTPVPLCGVCQEFIDALIAWGFKIPSDEARLLRCGPNSRWGEFGWYFEHYGASEEILKSAESCSLCRLLLDLFKLDDVHDMSGLHFYPFHGMDGGRPKTHGIQAQLHFKESFANGKYRIEPSCLLRVSRMLPYAHPVATADDSPYYERDVPESAVSQDCLDTIRWWFKDCVENHPCCHHPSTRSSVLPTRVIDIGSLPDDTPVLYISQGEEAPYVALSHCWGGRLPLKTTRDTLEAYLAGLPVHQLPRNFRDAIYVTRLVGLRYLWIDALCIVQDDPDDWAAEAERMTSVYRNSSLTISALNSEGPDAGFLGSRAQKSLLVSSGVVINGFRQGFSDAMENSVLSTRGWCMQERLLSPVVLHFGRDQMYWECCANTAEENRGCSRYNQPTSTNLPGDISRLTWNYRTPSFTQARKSFHVSGPRGCWYTAVEEYSHRSLTFRRDKLVAMAGVANLVRPAEAEGGSCIAGHFMGGRHDLLASLFWSARIKLTNGKAPGFRDIEVLTRPDDNYPSWSWASVDGGVQFHGDSSEGTQVELLDVKVNIGFDDVMAERVEARLKIRAAIARLDYEPDEPQEPDREIVGTIHPVAHSTAMDVNRDQRRKCWVLPFDGHGGHGVLVLDEVSPDVFRRIGWGERRSPSEGDPKVEFCTREFELI